MRIYFDMCSLLRPFDDQSQLRIRLEAEAIRLILALCRTGQATLVVSFALMMENKRNPYADRQAFVANLITRSAQQVRPSPRIEDEARRLIALGIKPMDALHLACAIVVDANDCCTCDDRFLKRGRSASTATTKDVSPIELVTELDL